MGQIQINGGRRWAEDRFAPNTFLTYELPDEPTDICLQLGEEDLILPGLLDMHTHLWAPPAVSSFGIAEEKYYATGFVGALDAGTYGVDGWEPPTASGGTPVICTSSRSCPSCRRA